MIAPYIVKRIDMKYILKKSKENIKLHIDIFSSASAYSSSRTDISNLEQSLKNNGCTLL
jgi:hypothetical protein